MTQTTHDPTPPPSGPPQVAPPADPDWGCWRDLCALALAEFHRAAVGEPTPATNRLANIRFACEHIASRVATRRRLWDLFAATPALRQRPFYFNRKATVEDMMYAVLVDSLQAEVGRASLEQPLPPVEVLIP